MIEWFIVIMVYTSPAGVPEESWASKAFYQSQYWEQNLAFESIEECTEVSNKIRISAGKVDNVIVFCDAREKK